MGAYRYTALLVYAVPRECALIIGRLGIGELGPVAQSHRLISHLNALMLG